jgi:hypothetical protein
LDREAAGAARKAILLLVGLLFFVVFFRVLFAITGYDCGFFIGQWLEVFSFGAFKCLLLY